MWLVTESPDFAQRTLGPAVAGDLASSPLARRLLPQGLQRLLDELVPGRAIYGRERDDEDGLPPAHLLLVLAPVRSQFDVAVQMVRDNQELPVFCIAGAGVHFRGHHGRSWTASLGNLHLTAIFVPSMQEVQTPSSTGAALIALPSVAVIDVLAAEPELSAYGIKWVNDVLLDGSKVAGVLAHTSWRGDKPASIVFGVGLNIEVHPTIAADPAVPAAICLKERLEEAQLVDYAGRLMLALHRRVEQWSSHGAAPIIESYRKALMVVGRRVEILKDLRPGPGAEPSLSRMVLRRGRVLRLDDELQLHLDDSPKPVREGRLRLLPG